MSTLKPAAAAAEEAGAKKPAAPAKKVNIYNILIVTRYIFLGASPMAELESICFLFANEYPLF